MEFKNCITKKRRTIKMAHVNEAVNKPEAQSESNALKNLTIKTPLMAGIVLLAGMALSYFSNSTMLPSLLHEVLMTEKTLEYNLHNSKSNLAKYLDAKINKIVEKKTSSFMNKPMTAFQGSSSIFIRKIYSESLNGCLDIAPKKFEEWEERCTIYTENRGLSLNFIAEHGDSAKLYIRHEVLYQDSEKTIENVDQSEIEKVLNSIVIRINNELYDKPYVINLDSSKQKPILLDFKGSPSYFHEIDISILDEQILDSYEVNIDVIVLVQFGNTN